MKQFSVFNQLKQEWVQVFAPSPAQAVQAASVQTIGFNATMHQEVVWGFCKVECGQFVLYLK